MKKIDGQPRPSVVLVHGLWMSGREMVLLRYRLHAAGFRTFRFSYPSRRATVAENAGRLQRFLDRHALTDNLHLVGHSLGGLVVLRFLHDFPAWPVRRSVALGSPFRGSRAAAQLARFAPTRWLLGRSLPEGLDGQGVCTVPPERTFASVAGDRAAGLALMILRLEPGNDGVVELAETRLHGPHRRLQHHTNHLGLVFSKMVANDVIRFLTD
ncbi:MAG: alpha/beta fold hydrolase [Magnetococcales bacterium]|nr:alpha/beta fold hydrolase [Magnetococcales bacterium]